jgi:hypothetical protein
MKTQIEEAVRRLQRLSTSRAPSKTVRIADLKIALEYLLRCGECDDCQEHMLSPTSAKRCPRMWKKSRLG